VKRSESNLQGLLTIVLSRVGRLLVFNYVTIIMMFSLLLKRNINRKYNLEKRVLQLVSHAFLQLIKSIRQRLSETTNAMLPGIQSLQEARGDSMHQNPARKQWRQVQHLPT